MKDQPGHPYAITDRTFEYAVAATELYEVLQGGTNRAGWKLGDQYVDAATSVGANVEEAQAAESTDDFIHKYGIAQKEARESRYWIRLLMRRGIVSQEVGAPLLQESGEIYAIITSIIVSAKKRRDNESRKGKR